MFASRGTAILLQALWEYLIHLPVAKYAFIIIEVAAREELYM